jgi:hypothetical protein
VKIVRGGARERWGTEYSPDNDPVTVLIIVVRDGPALFELRRWQLGETTLAPDRKGVTWCKGWGGPAAKALEALGVLDACVES